MILFAHNHLLTFALDCQGREAIEGIFLNVSNMEMMQLSHVAFSEMHNLRLLKLCRPRNWSENKALGSMFESSQTNHLSHLSNKLSLLHWDEYPYKSLPSNFSMHNLVELNMEGSRIEQLWDGDKVTILYICNCAKYVSQRGIKY